MFRFQASLHPVLLLLLFFAFWKTLLLLAVLVSPGPGYDTSTTLLGLTNDARDGSLFSGPTPSHVHPLILKFVRWDAIYYTHASYPGRVYEQEWAFGLGFPGLVSALSSRLSNLFWFDPLSFHVLLGLVISHGAHAGAVLLLYLICKSTIRGDPLFASRAPILAACLHIVSPAGVFLSAPCSESLFSFLNFLGIYLYLDSRGRAAHNSSIATDLETITAGFVLACATTVRSNGILGGLLFLYDAVQEGLRLLMGEFSLPRLRKLSSLIVGGCVLLLGAILPQYQAYSLFCANVAPQHRQPWCNSKVPSIYGWVQTHYWNVGLFRYWTVSNLPLFLIASPCLWMLLNSSRWAWRRSNMGVFEAILRNSPSDTSQSETLWLLAMPQAVLAIMAIATYHVQVINRLSSGYPLWYIWLANMIIHTAQQPEKGVEARGVIAQTGARFFVIYAIVQGALYACFLPPA